MTQCTCYEAKQRLTAVGGYYKACLHATACSTPGRLPVVWPVHNQLQLGMRAKFVLSQRMAAEVVEKLEAASD